MFFAPGGIVYFKGNDCQNISINNACNNNEHFAGSQLSISSDSLKIFFKLRGESFKLNLNQQSFTM
jgi:hypothetical protein